MSDERVQEAALWKSVDELIATIQENHDKLTKFIRLLQERADENAMRIFTECFNEAYEKKDSKKS